VTNNLRFETHIKRKLRDAMVALNSTWKNFMRKKSVPTAAKYKLFEAAARSIIEPRSGDTCRFRQSSTTPSSLTLRT